MFVSRVLDGVTPGAEDGAMLYPRPDRLAQIQAAAAKYFAPKEAGIVVVGDAAQIGKALEKFGKVTVRKAE